MNAPTTRRLTVAQALVGSSPASTPSATAERHRLIDATWGIFGHGNVAGIGQALLECRARTPMPVPPGPQRAGHGARRRRLRPPVRPALRPGRHHLHRPRRHQPRHRRRARHRQPAARCCCCPATPSPPAPADPVLQQLEVPYAGDVSVNDALRPVSRYFDRDHPARGADPRRPPGHAGARRPRRDRRRHPRAAAGRAGRGVRLAGGVLRRAGLARAPPRARRRRARRGRRARSAAARRPADRRGRRRPPQRGRGRAARPSPTPPASRSPPPRPARARCATTTPPTSAASATPAPPTADELARTADLVIGVGTRYTDFTTASAHPLRRARRALPQPQHRRLRRPQAGRAARWSPTPAPAWRRSPTALAGHRVDAAYEAEYARGKERWERRVDAAYARRGRAGAGPPRPRCSARWTRSSATTTWSSTRPARSPATCTSCGGPARRASTTWSTATPAWATRSRPPSACGWPPRTARCGRWSATARI